MQTISQMLTWSNCVKGLLEDHLTTELVKIALAYGCGPDVVVDVDCPHSSTLSPHCLVRKETPEVFAVVAETKGTYLIEALVMFSEPCARITMSLTNH